MNKIENNTQKAATTTTLPTQPTANFKERNDNFIKAFRRVNNIKTQTKLPSATQLHDEWAIRQGWSIVDATTWRRLVDAARTATDDIEGEGIIELLRGTLVIADRCNGHPIGLIHMARTEFGCDKWDIDALNFLTENLLPSTPSNGDEDYEEWQATQPTTPPQSPELRTAPGAPKRLRIETESEEEEHEALTRDEMF